MLHTDGDGGHSIYLLIQDYIVKDVKKEENTSKEDVKDDSNTGQLKEKFIKKREGSIDVVKFKDLKISGTIAGKGENKLSYTSLSYQIDNAKQLGYSDARICAAVIKAISPSSNLRTYLESKRTLSVDLLVEILRSHFKEKDSASVFTELSNAVQQTTETSLDFVIRLMCLRQKVLTLSREEKCPYDEELLSKRFFHTMFTGMRNSNIRADLREMCKNDFKISDEVLLKFVSEAGANEAERNEKFVTAKKGAINVVETGKQENIKDVKDKKKDNPFIQIEEQKLIHEKEMSFMRAELLEIKNAIQANTKPNLNSQETNFTQTQNYIPPHRRFPQQHENFSRKNKCRDCKFNNAARCYHCFKCGSTEHRMFACPQMNKKTQ